MRPVIASAWCASCLVALYFTNLGAGILNALGGGVLAGGAVAFALISRRRP